MRGWRFETDFDGILRTGQTLSRFSRLKNGSLPVTRQRPDSAVIELMAR